MTKIAFMPLHIYLLNISKPDPSFLQKIIPNLSQILQDKISKFRHAQDKWRVILSDLLVRRILSQELQIEPDSIKIEIGSYGKPSLQGKAREFNLSHSKDYIFFTTDDTPVGVDIEHIRPLDDLESLEKSCLSIKEHATSISKNKKQRLHYFYEIWTLKESYIKALGAGMNHSLQSFSIDISGETISLEHAGITENFWHFKKYTFINEYQAAICAQHCHFPECPKFISIADLLELI